MMNKRFFMLLLTIMGTSMTTTAVARTPISDDWLKNKGETLSAPVADYLAQENQLTQAYFQQHEGMYQTILGEMQAQVSPPQAQDCDVFDSGAYQLQSCPVGGPRSAQKAYKIKPLNAKKASWQPVYAPEVTKGTYYAAGQARLNAQGAVLAIGEDRVGTRAYTLSFYDVKTQKPLADQIPNTNGQAYFSRDGDWVYYVKNEAETLRPYQVYRHRLGTPSSDDALVYEAMNDHHNIGLYLTTSDAYLVINDSGATASQSLLIDRALPSEQASAQLFQPRQDGVEYYLAHLGADFYIHSNRDGQFALYATQSVKGPWRNLSVGLGEVEDYVVLKNWWVVLTRDQGRPILTKIHRHSGKATRLAFNDPNYLIELKTSHTQKNNELRYQYTSLTTPSRIAALNLDNGETKVISDKGVKGYVAADYVSDYLWLDSADGVKVPVTLVYKKSLFQAGKNPLIVYAYGAYGSNMAPRFSANRLSFLDRGFVYAIVHVRGGGELGKGWHEGGKGLHKKQSFTDFVQATIGLQAAGLGDPKRTYAMGESAGGLVMGVIANEAPERYRAIVAQRPFVDVLNTLLDDTLPLTKQEYSEWGNPNQPEYGAYIRSYAPYEQVKKQAYPALLVTSGRFDTQVPYWEQAKWVAKLKRHQQGRAPILLHTDMNSGHAYGQNRLTELAMAYGFIVSEDQAYLDSTVASRP
ncbi:MAG: S9 family peptidase [Neisseriaceae bacterium]|nr:S9 family peptidase [Neisseriaceae bacterium]